MSKSLSELDLKDEKLPDLSLDDLPEFGGFADPPQPGSYRFKLPDMQKVWDVYDSPKGQRVRAVFDRDYPLTITASRDGSSNGEPFQTRLSNQERPRGKDKTLEISDLDYLLAAMGEKTKPKTNKEYITKVTSFSGREFGGDVAFSFSCNDQKNIRVQDNEGKLQEVQNQMGCGKKYYMKDIQNMKGEDGKFPTLITCACGAALRTFANLDNIRA